MTFIYGLKIHLGPITKVCSLDFYSSVWLHQQTSHEISSFIDQIPDSLVYYLLGKYRLSLVEEHETEKYKWWASIM